MENSNAESLFSIQNENSFVQHALETFRYQYQHNKVYQSFVNYLPIQVKMINSIEQIPFLPIELYKTQCIISEETKANFFFQSSGTTQSVRSKHWLHNYHYYEKSIQLAFEQMIGDPKEYVFLGLLPSYSENPNSSLIYMVNFLMKLSGKPQNDYFLFNHSDLNDCILALEKTKQKYCLFGVSYALLDFLEKYQPKINHGIVIETGGMKGRKEEISKDVLLQELKTKFGTQNIYSEYSMTELLSQAYSLKDNMYQSPSWMRFLIRSVDDPFCYMNDKQAGAINIIDLANRYSCSFIATQDLGKKNNNYLEVIGRLDHTDIRGCSQLVAN